MRILAIGRARNSPEAELFARYAARIKPRLDLIEFNDGAGSPAEIKRREADALLAGLSPADYVIALDAAGAALDSLTLAQQLTTWTDTGKKLAFIIGGAEGLDAGIIARANTTLSLGNLTWPHLLARVLLAEQLYRAQMIAIGHPYHRSGRP